MTGPDLRHGLAQALALLDTLAPLAAAMGGPQVARAIAIAQAVGEFADGALEAVEAGTAIMSATDVAQVRDIVATIKLRNDAIAADIETG